MKLEDQVCSFELARRLEELGVKQDCNFAWVSPIDENNYILVAASRGDEYLESGAYKGHAAFTVAELGEMAKFRDPPIWNSLDFWEGGTEANARAIRLIHLIEKGMVKP